MNARAERRAIAALLTVFALLVQALVPSLAAAAQPAGAGVICTLTGAHAPHDGTPAPGRQPGGVCDHCLCALAAAPPPASTATPAPIRYALRAAPDRPARDGPAPGRGLAAPPPPSRGPPSLTA